MTLPYEVVCSADDDEQWRAARMTGIGASEIACVLGEGFISAYELYLIKRGEIPEPEFNQESLFWGRILERAIIQGFAEKSGWWAQPYNQLLRSKEHPWMLCTLDGRCCDMDSLPEEHRHHIIPPRQYRDPLEIKNWSSYATDQWIDGAPEKYRIQLHQQMAVTNRQAGVVAALLGGQQLAWEPIERDEQLIRRMVYAGTDFWRRVQEGDAPSADGSDSASRGLTARYPQHEERTVYLNEVLTARAKAARQQLDIGAALEASAKGLKNEIKQFMGDAGRAEGDGVVVTWRTSVTGARSMRITVEE